MRHKHTRFSVIKKQC